MVPEIVLPFNFKVVPSSVYVFGSVDGIISFFGSATSDIFVDGLAKAFLSNCLYGSVDILYAFKTCGVFDESTAPVCINFVLSYTIPEAPEA